jgi:ABC-type cobalamin/Fe3+-siderophores transport system ATPase subunit
VRDREAFGIFFCTGRGMIGHTLSVRNVTKRFGHLTAIDDISFDVRPREFISVIGPSGCGKTTLFNIIGGFVSGYEGTLLLDGQANVARRSIGMVFQEESTFPGAPRCRMWLSRSRPPACPRRSARHARGS